MFQGLRLWRKDVATLNKEVSMKSKLPCLGHGFISGRGWTSNIKDHCVRTSHFDCDDGLETLSHKSYYTVDSGKF
jgi:hypothetical protein